MVSVVKLTLVELPFFIIIIDALINLALGNDMSQWQGYVLVTNVGVTILGLALSFVGIIIFFATGNVTSAATYTQHVMEGILLLAYVFGINLTEIYIKLFTWPLMLILGPDYKIQLGPLKFSVKFIIDQLIAALRSATATAPYQGNTVKYLETVYNGLGWGTIDLSWAYDIAGLLTTGTIAYKVETSGGGGGGGFSKPVVK